MTQKMTGKQWLALAGIAVAAFVFNSSEFMPVGLLTDIGKTFGTNEATTGMLVSVYAWAVMLLSVPLMIIATRLDFRRLLLVVIVVFLVGQVLTSLSTSYWMLMAARMVVACAHSVFWAIAAPIAVRLVPKNKRALALSVVETGTAVAAIVGLPLGRAIGLAVGWAPDVCHCCGNLCAFAGVPAYHFALGSWRRALQHWAVAGVVPKQGLGGAVYSYGVVCMGLLHRL